MKSLFFSSVFFLLLITQVSAQTETTSPKFEIKVITSVESIVPNGLGRSRIISYEEDRNYKEFTSEQTEDDNTRNKSKRGDIRVKDFEETKLLNFYNIGI